MELMSDADMFLQVEESVRGGNSFVRERYYEESDDKQAAYIDANNLYGK